MSHVMERVSQEQAAPVLLALVEEVSRELHPREARRRALDLDAALDREAGIDSLGRVELLQRIERRFGVTLPAEQAVAAGTPRELMRLVLAAEPAPLRAPALPVVEQEQPREEGLGTPRQAETLPDVLRWHARAHPRAPYLHLLGDGEAVEVISFGALAEGAGRIAAGLSASGLQPGHSVGLMLPTGREFFFAFHGVLLAGGVPVPIYPAARPEQLEEHVRRQVGILDNAQARLLVASHGVERLGPLLRARLPGLLEVVTPETLHQRGEGGAAPALRIDPTSTALLQYTSGSTGAPKGVVLSHRNLLANVRVMGEVVQAGPRDVFVSWLPLYHDMGLIGACLGTLYYGCRLVLMSPLAFIARPRRWLEELSRWRGTLSAAPNFAFAMCAAKLRDEDLAGLDLSSWRIAFDGAEAVDPDTVEAFTRRFAPCGLRPETVTPVYGLAESSVGLCFPVPGRPARVDRVRRDPLLLEGRADPAADDDPHATRFMSCGVPLPEHELRIVDEAGRELGERQVGRLLFRGPSATSGYHRNPEATAALRRHEGWLDTGDHAYLAGGELFVTGRVKDLLKKAGRGFYPDELEHVAGRLPGVRAGCVALFGARPPGAPTEQLVLLAETRLEDEAEREQLRQRLVETTLEVLGVPPDRVLLAPPHTVPKTSSGKVRRSECRDRYQRGELLEGRSPAWQKARLVAGALAGVLVLGLRATRAWLRSAWTWVAGLPFGGLLALIGLLVPGQDRRRRWASRAIRAGAWLAGYRLRLEGGEHLVAAGPQVLVANHQSYIDPLVLAALLPARCTFLGKREVLGSPYLRLLMRRYGHRTVERFDPRQGLEDVAQVTAAVRGGESVVFFGEGTFVRAPGLRELRLGAFRVAVETGAPVVPVAIRGTRQVFPADQWRFRAGQISVSVAPPIAAAAGGGWQEVLRLREATRAALLARCGEPDLAAEPVLPNQKT